MDNWKSACISQGSTRETELVEDGCKENYCKEVAKAAVEVGWAGLKPTGWTTRRGAWRLLGRSEATVPRELLQESLGSALKASQWIESCSLILLV